MGAELERFHLMHQLAQADDLFAKNHPQPAKLVGDAWRLPGESQAQRGHLDLDARDSLNHAVVEVACNTPAFHGGGRRTQAAHQIDVLHGWGDLPHDPKAEAEHPRASCADEWIH